MVRRILIFLSILLLLGISFLFPTQADSDVTIYLQTGKNEVQFSEYVYASELIAWNPDIEYIAYYDEFLNRRIAYVNVFGGVGDNFLTHPSKTYEISVKENIGLIIAR